MFTHNLDPILFEFGFLVIRWYSLAYIFGILIGWWLGKSIVLKRIKYVQLHITQIVGLYKESLFQNIIHIMNFLFLTFFNLMNRDFKLRSNQKLTDEFFASLRIDVSINAPPPRAMTELFFFSSG